MNFKNFYNIENMMEAIAVADVNPTAGKKEVVLTLGRFQPYTAGHYKVIEQMKREGAKDIVIFLVKGGKSSQDKNKNPLDSKDQIKIIKKSVGKNVKDIIEIPDGFLGTFVNELRNRGLEPTSIYVGSDRVKTFQAQIDKYKDDWNINMNVKEIVRTGEDVSATKVRQSIKDDDFDTFKTMTVNLGKKEFDFLRKKIK